MQCRKPHKPLLLNIVRTRCFPVGHFPYSCFHILDTYPDILLLFNFTQTFFHLGEPWSIFVKIFRYRANIAPKFRSLWSINNFIWNVNTTIKFVVKLFLVRRKQSVLIVMELPFFTLSYLCSMC